MTRTCRVATALLLLSTFVRPQAQAAVGEGDGALLATLADPAVVESSGLAASRRSPGILWTHNDSGDAPLLYATDRQGQALGRFAVPGADNTDWEDLAVGPGPAGINALYLADTGDNVRRRDQIAIYRLPEPAIDPDAPAAFDPTPTVATDRFPLVYPDGPHDAETLLLHPTTGELLLVTKDWFAPAGIYRVPPLADPDVTAALVRIADLTLPGLGPAQAATGGAVSPDGTRLAIRTPVAAYEWTIARDGSLEAALARQPRRLALPPTPRGEAIAYRADGAALLLTTEAVPCPLYELPLAPPAVGRGRA